MIVVHNTRISPILWSEVSTSTFIIRCFAGHGALLRCSIAARRMPGLTMWSRNDSRTSRATGITPRSGEPQVQGAFALRRPAT